MKGALLGCILLLAAIGRAETPAAPVDFDYPFGYADASDPGFAPGDFAAWPVPEIPVRTVVVAPMDPKAARSAPGSRSRAAEAKSPHTATSALMCGCGS